MVVQEGSISPSSLLSVLAALTFYRMVSGRVDAASDDTVRYEIKEQIPVGTRIGNLVHDVGLRRKYSKEALQRLEFAFLAEPGLPISVGFSDGVVVTTGEIDRDSMPLCRQKDMCEIYIDVAVGPVQYFRIIKISLTIEDINDNPPRFPESPHTHISILEASSAGSTFLLPSATDIDSPTFGVHRYELDKASDDDDATTSTSSRRAKFGLRVTPKLDGLQDVRLVLLERLDRESRDHYRLRLTAFDGGMPLALNASVDIDVHVLDSNDNDPVFDASAYDAVIDENAPLKQVILRLRATDADLGVNGLVRYVLGSQTPAPSHGAPSLFAVDAQTGEVYVDGLVDREKSAVYSIVVKATDGGPDSRTGDVTVTITIRDLNDNAPRITLHSLPGLGAKPHVHENAPAGTFVAHVTARDPDEGRNGTVNCTLQEGPEAGGSKFALVPRSLQTEPASDLGQASTSFSAPEVEYQILTGVKHDREENDRFNLTVVCWDAGNPMSMTSLLDVYVIITDENDNRPAFDRDIYRAIIRENNAIGADIIQVTATDLDADNNGQVRYIIAGPAHAQFSVDQTGHVTARQSFDRETTSVMRFQVLAIDGGRPSQTGSSMIIVDIEDENDDRPSFIHPTYSFSVLENEPIGTSIGTVTARDRDLYPHSIFLYSFLYHNSATEKFDIDARNGTVFTRETLDREKQHIYYLIVTAVETSRTLEGTAVDRHIESHDAANNVAGRATEYDMTRFSRQGAIISSVDNGASDAFDASSTATIVISVLDDNDNAPQFVFPSAWNNSVQISNRVPVNHVVATLTAVDSDIADNARITFRLIERGMGVAVGARAVDGAMTGEREVDGRSVFSVDPIRGLVRTKEPLDGFQFRQFQIFVAALDHGEPQRSASTYLNIIVNHSFPYDAQNDVNSEDDDSVASVWNGSRTSPFPNVVIVFGVGCGVVLVSVILVAIVMLTRHKRSLETAGEGEEGEEEESCKYNGSCRQDEFMMFSTTSGTVTGESKEDEFRSSPSFGGVPVKSKESSETVEDQLPDEDKDPDLCLKIKSADNYCWSVWTKQNGQAEAVGCTYDGRGGGGTGTDVDQGETVQGYGENGLSSTINVDHNPKGLYHTLPHSYYKITKPTKLCTPPPPPHPSLKLHFPSEDRRHLQLQKRQQSQNQRCPTNNSNDSSEVSITNNKPKPFVPHVTDTLTLPHPPKPSVLSSSEVIRCWRDVNSGVASDTQPVRAAAAVYDTNVRSRSHDNGYCGDVSNTGVIYSKTGLQRRKYSPCSTDGSPRRGGGHSTIL